MYDEPPDLEPTQCPLCEDELGYNDSCEHCRMAVELSKTRSELHTLRVRLAGRARILADQTLYLDGEQANGIAPRFLQAAALLMDLAGIKFPDEAMAEPRALLSEYGEYGGNKEKDAARVERWLGMQWQARRDSIATGFTSDVLDRRGLSPQDTLWVLNLKDGTQIVATEAEKRALDGGWTGGCGGPWGSSLREFINDALQRAEGNAAFWLEFQREYLKPTAEFKQGTKVSYVVGDNAYTAYVGHYEASPYGGTGFGGAPFQVRLTDGREFFTNNNWARGAVPPKLRKLLPANALFVPVPQKADTPAAA